ncbi:UNVERIFIED_CONTAM: hypothetical protein H355_011792 [Colinus virginianus]|nr:hypothetical protein H355_011792 [Colinus virginianus]
MLSLRDARRQVICQWGFDDEANHLLLHENLPAIRWVGGAELEMVAIATGGRIVPRWEELTPEKLGSAAAVGEISSGTMGDKFVVIEGCGKAAKAVTIVVCAGNQMLVAEAERCLHDALCVVRNLLRDSRVVGGGAAAELAAAVAVEKAADAIAGVEQYSVRAFADALTSVAEALAENCGLHAIEEVQKVKSMQVTKNYPYFGLDCMQRVRGLRSSSSSSRGRGRGGGERGTPSGAETRPEACALHAAINVLSLRMWLRCTSRCMRK